MLQGYYQGSQGLLSFFCGLKEGLHEHTYKNWSNTKEIKESKKKLTDNITRTQTSAQNPIPPKYTTIIIVSQGSKKGLEWFNCLIGFKKAF